MTASILARFPADRFDLAPDLTMNYEPIWQEILVRYPASPSVSLWEEEAASNFFADLIKRPSMLGHPAFLIRSDTGQTYLAAKQTVLDFFANNERWIGRSFYAATGRVMWTEFKKAEASFIASYPRLIPPVTPRRQIEPSGLLDTTHQARASFQRENAHYVNQVRQGKEHNRTAVEHWRATYGDKRRAHMDRWGSWFFEGLRHAFEAPAPASTATQTHSAQDGAAGSLS